VLAFLLGAAQLLFLFNFWVRSILEGSHGGGRIRGTPRRWNGKWGHLKVYRWPYDYSVPGTADDCTPQTERQVKTPLLNGRGPCGATTIGPLLAATVRERSLDRYFWLLISNVMPRYRTRHSAVPENTSARPPIPRNPFRRQTIPVRPATSHSRMHTSSTTPGLGASNSPQAPVMPPPAPPPPPRPYPSAIKVAAANRFVDDATAMAARDYSDTLARDARRLCRSTSRCGPLSSSRSIRTPMQICR